MKLRPFLLLLLCVFIGLGAFATSVPAFGDSTSATVSPLPGVPAKEKKVGFFGKIKKKLLTLAAKQQVKNGEKASTRKILGWLALGMVLLSIGLLFLSVSGTGTALLFFGGLLAGLVALLLPKTQAEKEQNRKSSNTALIALGIGIGFVIALVIIFSATSWQ